MDFIKKVGKLNNPTFDGSSRCSTQARVHKLDTYFKLNPMIESETINFVTLHLDGEAHEWWYHGLVTLGHVVALYTLGLTWKKPSIHLVCPWGQVLSQGVVTGSSTLPSRSTPSEAKRGSPYENNLRLF
jgi:hypothetical protein